MVHVIDIHTHIIPGIDDGPPDMVGTVAMAEVAAANGIHMLAATPHVREDHPAVRPDEIAQRAEEVDGVLRGHGIDLSVAPGAELAITAMVEMSDSALRAITLGGNGGDLLVETPYGALPYVFEELLADLRQRGFRITLAHPERNPTLQRDPARLGALIESGILVQLTASSLAAGKRSPAREVALEALEQGWAHVIASDAHSADWRPPDLSAGLHAAGRSIPSLAAELEWMVTVAPFAIIHGDELPPRPERPPRARSTLLRRRR